MTTIHKYRLTESVTDVRTHAGAEFLAVNTQGEQVTVWAEVDPTKREVVRTLYQVPTGGTVPAHTEYIGTALLTGGMFVFHVYATPAPRP